MLSVIPLGTGSALPSKRVHFSATAVKAEKGLFLFDCGEGTQHQLLHAGLRASRLKAICITHLHGDHFYGLPGLLSTLSLLRHEKPLLLIGPRGILSFIDSLSIYDPATEWSFPLTIEELDHNTGDQTVFNSDRVNIEAHPIEHSVPAFGYRIKEADKPGNLDVDKAKALGILDFNDYKQLKNGLAVQLDDGRQIYPDELVSPGKQGAVFAYITDTRPCTGGIQLARNADLVYHEATFLHKDQGRALKTMHATAQEAAEIAIAASAQKLLIGHFSAIYKDPDQLVAEAQSVFKNTEAADELKQYLLPAASDE